MNDKALELIVACLGLTSGVMAAVLAYVVAAPAPTALYSAAAASRAEVMEAGLVFFLGASILSAGILYLRRPRKRQAER